ncbi:unnamed protein product, partial [Ectocarpus sp. 12 AP-2014]
LPCRRPAHVLRPRDRHRRRDQHRRTPGIGAQDCGGHQDSAGRYLRLEPCVRRHPGQ